MPYTRKWQWSEFRNQVADDEAISRVLSILQREGIDEDEAELLYKDFEVEQKEVSPDERSITSYISTIAVDRDGEVLLPKGAVLDDYRKLPVVLPVHDYRALPIGKAAWIKADKKGLIGKTIYARHAQAEEYYQYRMDGFPMAESVGFIPLEWQENGKDAWSDGHGTEGWADTLKDWKDQYQAAYGKKPKQEPNRIFTKWLLLEYSDVPVPSNPDALQLMMSKGLVTQKQAELWQIPTEIKRVITYGAAHSGGTPVAPKDFEWDAGKEVSSAELPDLKVMCAWVDSENDDTKSAYKFPHHRAAGEHPVVYKALAAGIAVLNGGRGGSAIPDSDRRGVYNHLAKHYRDDFDEDPPELRSMEQENADGGVFGEIEVLRSMQKRNEMLLELLKDPDSWEEQKEAIRGFVKANAQAGEKLLLLVGIEERDEEIDLKDIADAIKVMAVENREKLTETTRDILGEIKNELLKRTGAVI
jgi:hypothetical protein